MTYCLDGMPNRSDDEACQVMIQNFPECITIPKPTMSNRRYMEHIPGLFVNNQKRQAYFDLGNREDELAEFYDRYLANDMDYFNISSKFISPLYTLKELYDRNPFPEVKYINVVIPGIYAWGLSIVDIGGKPSIYDETQRDLIVKSLSMKAKWQEEEAKKLFPGVSIMCTVGDAALSVLSSAVGTGSLDDIKNNYNDLLQPIDCLKCIHCCSNFDWSLLMKTGFDCINLDAYQYGYTMALYARELNDFLERGGSIAWGIVPTAGSGGDIRQETPQSLVEKMEDVFQTIVARGVNKQQLLKASWISPSCETTSMSIELADRVYSVTREVSQLMRIKYDLDTGYHE
jgi:hypothetical protein